MKSRKQERGFTVVEIAIVVLAMGIVAAFAAPRITNAMREYRLTMAARQLSDLIQRAKTQAMSENKTVTLRVDSTNRQVGIVVKDSSGSEVRTDYVSLPQGVTFARPTNVNAPMTNAPFTNNISFPLKSGSTTVFQQDFNSRGFPAVATAGAINAIYITNSRNYRAITLTCVGGITNWVWQTNKWVNTLTAKSAG